MHVNANCVDLARSLAFYRDAVGLSAQVRTNPDPQPGVGFGLEGDVQWDAHILYDEVGTGAALDLLEWKTPAPVGAAPSNPMQLGIARLGFSSPDLAETKQAVQACGGTVVAPPAPVAVADNTEMRLLFARDPDGILLEFVEMLGARRFLHVNINCSDVVEATAWYERVLGLDVVLVSQPGPLSGAVLGVPGEIEWDARLLALPGQADRFLVDLLQWKHPLPAGTGSRQANEVGLYRMALLVDDIDVALQDLREHDVEVADPVTLDMGPGVPVDGLRAAFFDGPDGECLELIEA